MTNQFLANDTGSFWKGLRQPTTNIKPPTPLTTCTWLTNWMSQLLLWKTVGESWHHPLWLHRPAPPPPLQQRPGWACTQLPTSEAPSSPTKVMTHNPGEGHEQAFQEAESPQSSQTRLSLSIQPEEINSSGTFNTHWRHATYRSASRPKPSSLSPKNRDDWTRTDLPLWPLW